jgi:hypothetical protein
MTAKKTTKHKARSRSKAPSPDKTRPANDNPVQRRADELLDDALKETFPSSDPVSVPTHDPHAPRQKG